MQRNPTATTESAPQPDRQVANQRRDLLATLVRELFQTERSAQRHPAREAERYGDSAPSRALRAVSEHATAVLAELPGVVESVSLPDSTAGRTVGELLSLVRDNVTDRLVDAERSYRGTLLGMRHGVDLVRLIQRVADAGGLVELGGFCTRWLAAREPLIHDVELAMSWFAEHPGEAAHTSKWLPARLRRITQLN
jgi:hypothetical protein